MGAYDDCPRVQRIRYIGELIARHRSALHVALGDRDGDIYDRRRRDKVILYHQRCLCTLYGMEA